MKSFFQGLYALIAIALMAFSMYLFAKVVSTNDLTHLLTPASYTLTIPVIVLLLAIIFLCLSTIEERDEHINELKQISTDMHNKLHETNRNLQQSANTLSKINDHLKNNYGNILNVFIVAALLTGFISCQKELTRDTAATTLTTDNTALVRDTLMFHKGYRRDTAVYQPEPGIAVAFFQDMLHLLSTFYMGKLVIGIHHTPGIHATYLTVWMNTGACAAEGICYGTVPITDTTKRVVINYPVRIPVEVGVSWPWNDIEIGGDATVPVGGWIRYDIIDIHMYRSDTARRSMPTKGLPATGTTLVSR